jgi:hypothetical protein
MYFLDALRVLLRRWYVVAAGLLLTALGTAAALNWVPTSHQASGQALLLLPSEISGAESPSNPYLNLPDELTMTASIVAGSMTTRDAERDLVRDGFTSSYSVAVNPGGGPLILITTEDTDAAEALATRDELISRVGAELDRMQSEVGVPTRQWIHTSPTAVTKRAEALPGSKMRAGAATVGAGLTVTLLMAFVVDRFRSRRRPAAARPEPEVEAPREDPPVSGAPSGPAASEKADDGEQPASEGPRRAPATPEDRRRPERRSPTKKGHGVPSGTRR